MQNYSKRAEALDPLRSFNFDFACATPLLARNRVIGSLNFYSKEANRDLSPEEVYYFDHLARQGSIAILNAQLFQELENKTKTIQKTQNYLDLILDNSSQVIINANLGGKITYWNATAQLVLGYTKDEITGENIPLWPGKSTEKFHELFLRVRKGDTFEDVRVLCVNKEKQKVLMSLAVVPIKDESNKIVSILVTGQDITEKRKLELQMDKSREVLEDRNAQLELALRRLESTQEKLLETEKLSSVVDLADGISHEINNPLMGIINYAQILVDELEENPKLCEAQDSEMFREYLTGILEESTKIEKITRDLTTLSRFESYGSYRPTRIADVVENVVKTLSPTAEEVGVQIEIDYRDQSSRECLILGRYELLATALENLLKNALGGIRDKVGRAEGNKTGDLEISVALYSKKINLRPFVFLEVEDTGTPIPSAFIPKFFDPFPRINVEDTPRVTRGLEMSIVLSVIKSHEGNIKVQVTKDGKTRFVVSLPLVKDSETIK